MFMKTCVFVYDNVYEDLFMRQGKFSEKQTFLTPPDTYAYLCVSGDNKCLFYGKFVVLYFPETPVLRFALLPYYRRLLYVAIANNSHHFKPLDATSETEILMEAN